MISRPIARQPPIANRSSSTYPAIRQGGERSPLGLIRQSARKGNPMEKPNLVDTVASWIGRPPDSFRELSDSDWRWTWRWEGYESFEREFVPHWKAWEESVKDLPMYVRHRLCISVCWPSQEVHQILVILRDETKDVWCMAPEDRWNVKWFREYFCRGCHIAKTHCECNKPSV